MKPSCVHCGEPLFAGYGTTIRKYHENDSQQCHPRVKIAFQLERIANILERIEASCSTK